jgi:hypothetical protein
MILSGSIEQGFRGFMGEINVQLLVIVGSGIFKGIHPVEYRSTLALEPTKFSSKSSHSSQLPDGFMAHLRYSECASYLQFLKEICFTLFISPLHFRKFSPLTHSYFNNETTIMVANSLAPMFLTLFRPTLMSMGSRFHSVTLGWKKSLTEVRIWRNHPLASFSA